MFDGNGHTISNLVIKEQTKGMSDYSCGFIRNNYGKIENIVFDKCEVCADGKEPKNVYIGIVCGFCYLGTISNVIVNEGNVHVGTGTSSVDTDFVSMAGGICGSNCGIIEKCGVTGTLVESGKTHTKFCTSFAYAGGIAGNNFGDVVNCYSRKNSIHAVTGACCYHNVFVESKGMAVSNSGGIVGRNHARVENSLGYLNTISAYNDSEEGVKNLMAGGSIVGFLDTNSVIINCYSNVSDILFGSGESSGGNKLANITVFNAGLPTSIWIDSEDGPIIREN